MFSRALKPVASVAVQNGAKNFSTTSQVSIQGFIIMVFSSCRVCGARNCSQCWTQLCILYVKSLVQWCGGFQKNFKVAVAGAAGGIGQPLALLLKQNPLVTRLALYDIAPVTPGVGVDLSHMDTPAKVTGHQGPDQLADAIKGKKKLTGHHPAFYSLK